MTSARLEMRPVAHGIVPGMTTHQSWWIKAAEQIGCGEDEGVAPSARIRERWRWWIVTAIPDVNGNVILLATRTSIGRTGRVGGLHQTPLDGRQNKNLISGWTRTAGMAVSPGTRVVSVTATHILLTSSRPEGL